MRWFTSDTHYGHANIIRFCDRPYVDVHHMNVDLVERAAGNFNAGDELWHLGDVALGHLDSSLINLARLPVDVTLVAGNHDRCHPYNGTRAETFIDLYEDRCQLAALVRTNTTLVLTSGTTVNVSHFPYADPTEPRRENRHGKVIEDKFASWRVEDDGSWLLCGHVHDNWRQRGRMINVGVDAWGGYPVSEAQIIDLIGSGPQDRDVLPWVAGSV